MKFKVNNSRRNVLVDDKDFKRISGFTWFVRQSNSCKYIVTDIYKEKKRKTIRLHRFIMNCPEGLFVDHVNKNTFDNRRSNLRICTTRENNLNKRIANQYGVVR